MLGKKQAFCARLIATFAAMKEDFLYSTDFYGMNARELSHTCMHLLCLAGEASFVFNEHCYHIVKNDLVVIPMPDRVKNLAAHADLQVEWFAADYKFLQNLLPSNNYSIGGSISLNQDPVIKLSDEQAQHLLDDFHRLRDRKDDRHLQFYRELMGSLCLTMMYDIFEAHAQRESTDSHTDRTAYIVKQLMTLLSTGISRTERDVSYYAERLNVSPKYLSATIKRVTGHSVTSYTDELHVALLLQPLLHQASRPVAQRLPPESSTEVRQELLNETGIRFALSLQPESLSPCMTSLRQPRPNNSITCERMSVSWVARL